MWIYIRSLHQTNCSHVSKVRAKNGGNKWIVRWTVYAVALACSVVALSWSTLVDSTLATSSKSTRMIRHWKLDSLLTNTGLGAFSLTLDLVSGLSFLAHFWPKWEKESSIIKTNWVTYKRHFRGLTIMATLLPRFFAFSLPVHPRVAIEATLAMGKHSARALGIFLHFKKRDSIKSLISVLSLPQQHLAW